MNGATSTVESADSPLSPREQDSSEKAQQEPAVTDHIQPGPPNDATHPATLSSTHQTKWSCLRWLRDLGRRDTWKGWYRSIVPKNLELGFFIVMGGYEIVNEKVTDAGSEVSSKLRKAAANIPAGESPTRIDSLHTNRDSEGQKEEWLDSLWSHPPGPVRCTTTADNSTN